MASDLLLAISCEPGRRSVSEATVAAHSLAAREWGAAVPGSFDYLERISQLALVVNGSNDIVVPTVNSYTLQQNLPDAELIL